MVARLDRLNATLTRIADVAEVAYQDFGDAEEERYKALEADLEASRGAPMREPELPAGDD